MTELVALALRHFSLCLVGSYLVGGIGLERSVQLIVSFQVVAGKMLLLLSKLEGDQAGINAEQVAVGRRHPWLPGAEPGSREQALVSNRSPANPRLVKEGWRKRLFNL